VASAIENYSAVFMLERLLKLPFVNVNGRKESITDDTFLGKRIRRDAQLSALRIKGYFCSNYPGGAQISN